ncbi:MAG: metalloenzyme [Chloroflexi bacterium]|nr:metalloenzyme [Chloroflexota bacterium]
MALIFVMIDGVGLAPTGPHNPVAGGMTRLTGLLDAPLTDALHIETANLRAVPIDATLGLPGLPQSGSGHSAIYGGFNAAAFNGRHQPSYPTIAMREYLSQQNLFQSALDQGARVVWANGYLPGYLEVVAQRRLRHTAGTWAAMQAGLGLRGLAELQSGAALGWDISHALLRTRLDNDELPLITPEAAGARLAALAQTADLVAYETYLPDLAAHERLDISVEAALALVDGLIGGILDHRSADDTLILTSDHGNSEDQTTRVHTRNPVPLIVSGPAARHFAAVRSIDELAAAMLVALKET